MKADFEYQVGDLVSFNSRRLTEEYIDDFVLTGIIIKQRLVFTADNKFLVKTPEKNYWVSRPALTLLSRAQNKKLDRYPIHSNITCKERTMSVQNHIENILNAEGQECLDAWYIAINEYPQNAIEIHDVVVDHLVENTFMY